MDCAIGHPCPALGGRRHGQSHGSFLARSIDRPPRYPHPSVAGAASLTAGSAHKFAPVGVRWPARSSLPCHRTPTDIAARTSPLPCHRRLSIVDHPCSPCLRRSCAVDARGRHPAERGGEHPARRSRALALESCEGSAWALRINRFDSVVRARRFHSS